MLSPKTFDRRRAELLRRLDGQAVLLVGTSAPPRTSPYMPYGHRQDSTFLYFTGCEREGAAALIDGDGCTLFIDPPADDDDLWHGHVETLEGIGAHYGVVRVRPASELEAACAGRSLATVGTADPGRTALAARLTGQDTAYFPARGHDALTDAIISMRRIKSDEELAEHRQAAHITSLGFRAAMASTHVGGNEAHIAALFDAVLAARGCGTGYHSIVTVRGEVLHNPHYVNPLAAGDLLLLDGGGERPSGYGVDITRTWPVDGRYSGRQRAAYEAVLAAELASIDLCRPGVRYRDVHMKSAEVLARWLLDEGLLRGSLDAVMESHATAAFFPHGVGHLLGLDTHDLEQFWDRAGYAPGRERSTEFGTAYLRMDLDLEPGFLFTIEPGFYVVPGILRNAALRETWGDLVDWDKYADWIGFGGIRIEDDVLCTEDGSEVLTHETPKTIADVEGLIGTGASALDRLSP
ncbi:MAG: M24 family metallopeptidase [Proteobacteria bacterium]|nr:M24 family metallopeptidase [Pseudomonadota bacterium]MCP4916889.1 M24 family metallopeptidase [Pseudomonadota bacterium]